MVWCPSWRSVFRTISLLCILSSLLILSYHVCQQYLLESQVEPTPPLVADVEACTYHSDCRSNDCRFGLCLPSSGFPPVLTKHLSCGSDSDCADPGRCLRALREDGSEGCDEESTTHDGCVCRIPPAVTKTFPVQLLSPSSRDVLGLASSDVRRLFETVCASSSYSRSVSGEEDWLCDLLLAGRLRSTRNVSIVTYPNIYGMPNLNAFYGDVSTTFCNSMRANEELYLVIARAGEASCRFPQFGGDKAYTSAQLASLPFEWTRFLDSWSPSDSPCVEKLRAAKQVKVVRATELLVVHDGQRHVADKCVEENLRSKDFVAFLEELSRVGGLDAPVDGNCKATDVERVKEEEERMPLRDEVWVLAAMGLMLLVVLVRFVEWGCVGEEKTEPQQYPKSLKKPAHKPDGGDEGDSKRPREKSGVEEDQEGSVESEEEEGITG